MADLTTGGYATESDLAAWITPDGVPENWLRLLRSASFVVADATKRDVYTDTPAAADADPLRDATCAQAVSWIALGVDPNKNGSDMPGPVKSSTILDGKVDRDTSEAAKLAVAAVEDLCDESERILRAAGLLWLPMPLGDSAPYLLTYGLSAGPSWRGQYLGEGICAGDWPFR